MGDWDEWIGSSTRVDDVVDPGQARKMQAVLDRDSSIAVGDVLPPAWHWLYFHQPVAQHLMGTDGHPALGVNLPAFPLARRMWAGGALQWHAPLVAGVPASRTSTIRAIERKQGRTGALIFVTIDHDVHQGGTLCVAERQDVVYRDATSTSGPAPATPAETTCDYQATWQFDAVSLFRYSALTFNGHRIHYDVDYVRDVEDYPNVIVHGPLLATLLLDVAATNGYSVTAMEYRAKSPVFLPSGVTVRAQREGDQLSVWACDDAGGLAMAGVITVA